MQKITIDTRILVNGVMYCNSTESAYIDMNNKIPASYKHEKDNTLNYLFGKSHETIYNKLVGLKYSDKPETKEKKK